MPAFPLYSFPTVVFLLVLSLHSFAAPVHAISAKQNNLRPGVTRIEVPQTIGGKTIRREVLIHAPRSRNTSKRYPVLFALHGNGGRHSNFLRPLQPFIEQEAFVGIYPQGYPH